VTVVLALAGVALAAPADAATKRPTPKVVYPANGVPPTGVPVGKSTVTVRLGTKVVARSKPYVRLTARGTYAVTSTTRYRLWTTKVTPGTTSSGTTRAGTCTLTGTPKVVSWAPAYVSVSPWLLPSGAWVTRTYISGDVRYSVEATCDGREGTLTWSRYVRSDTLLPTQVARLMPPSTDRWRDTWYGTMHYRSWLSMDNERPPVAGATGVPDFDRPMLSVADPYLGELEVPVMLGGRYVLGSGTYGQHTWTVTTPPTSTRVLGEVRTRTTTRTVTVR
jgi:hypothetical protein